jgi:hypothetical protein
MNSYINLILDAEGAKERLRQLFRSAPEPEKNSPPLSVPVRQWRERRKRRRAVRSKAVSPSGGTGHDVAGVLWAAQSGMQVLGRRRR